MRIRPRKRVPPWLLTSFHLFVACVTAQAGDLKFDFGSGSAQPGAVQVPPGAAYDPKRGFGFLESMGGAPDQPRVFAVDLAEGNYDVTMRCGDAKRPTSTTVKAESRRLMLEKVETAPGRFETRTFTVNVRRPLISTGGAVMLNDREKGPPVAPDWDDRLTLEFNGAHPGVASLEIKPAPDAVTIFLAGDSTVTDQVHEPWAGWGQMLPRFFQQGIAVSNQAESGLALGSFEHQRRLEKILSMLKKGDYLFIQFGHNDQRDKTPGAGPFTTYKANLQRYVAAARKGGGLPVLITSMERRHWEGEQFQPSLAAYAEAVRQVGTEEKVPVIDLNAMSIKFYSALGPEKSTQAFVFYPAGTFPGQDKELKDNTHHNNYGAYELARCVVEGIKTSVPALAPHLTKDTAAFDPSHPDPPENIHIPASPVTAAPATPAGN